jgi:flagellar capping protein FliD
MLDKAKELIDKYNELVDKLKRLQEKELQTKREIYFVLRELKSCKS